MRNPPIKIIDLFAGPGGLGEGFSACKPNNRKTSVFKIALSVEKEESAWKTLRLRAFARQFLNKGHSLPKEYYEYISGKYENVEKLLNQYPKQRDAANNEALQFELGKDDNKILDKLIKSKVTKKEPWVLIGGPPCQAYSLVGRVKNQSNKNYKAEEDNRNFLYEQYLRVIAKHEPSIFIMENVKGILSAKVNGEKVFDKIVSDLQKPSKATDIKSKHSYRIYSLVTDRVCLKDGITDFDPHDFVIKCEDYGIPQSRHRVILLGIRDDIKTTPDVLLKQEIVTVSQVIGGLPERRSGLSKDNNTVERWSEVIAEETSLGLNEIKKQNPELSKYIETRIKIIKKSKLSIGNNFYVKSEKRFKNMPLPLKEWFSDENLNGITNHECRGHMNSDLARYIYCSAFAKINSKKLFRSSPKLPDFPIKFLPNHKNAKSGKFVDRFKVQEANLPATTITSHISKDGHAFIHYDSKQCRSLTVREAARIQTFPDNYFFEGTRTQQYVQVGNAVPSFLANKISYIVYQLLKEVL